MRGFKDLNDRIKENVKDREVGNLEMGENWAIIKFLNQDIH